MAEKHKRGASGFGDANEKPRLSSISLKGLAAFAGAGNVHRERNSAHESPIPPAGHPMGMSVALEADARQAAADKRAEEYSLVRRAQEGDRLAFEDLVRRYDRDVLRLALNLVHRPEDARDIYQE
ncbi:MAG: RNA polymerase sigma factor, partial [Limisphaerales bacterium]